MNKRILLISGLSGLYLVLLLSGVANRLASFSVTGVVVELLTIPAIILQVALFAYVLYRLLSKRLKLSMGALTPVAVFLVLFIWAVLQA